MRMTTTGIRSDASSRPMRCRGAWHNGCRMSFSENPRNVPWVFRALIVGLVEVALLFQRAHVIQRLVDRADLYARATSGTVQLSQQHQILIVFRLGQA